MFITPIPPTRSEIPAMIDIATEIVDNIDVIDSSIDDILEHDTSKLSLFL